MVLFGGSRVVVVIAVALAGCGEDEGVSADAAASDGGDGLLQIPWLTEGVPPIAAPDFGECPAGWRAVDDPDGSATETTA